MKRILQITAVFAFLIAGSLQLNAQEVKIGYVDPQAILSRMPETAAVSQRIQNLQARKQQELTQKEQEFQNEVTLFQQKASVITEEAKTAEEERLGQLQAELLTFRDDAEREVQTRRAELLNPLYQQIFTAIETVAKRKELTYVLNTTTSTGDVIILYASEEIRNNFDITEDVMQELNIFE